ncbi:MAG: PD40 domain-containing protein [Prevotella sp.]|nr:PD40 domain-containing protein [Prevotella sp.]MBQ8628504.1 PD40 domain-containing protein [Prevotella sp.]MEE1092441.1 hypothetical protein [Prevotella sp.]
MRKSKLFLSLILAAYVSVVNAQVDYSVVYVNEEAGVEFTQVTSENDYVCMPMVKRGGGMVNWLSNKIIDISVDGVHLAYLSARNNTTNIFIKDIEKKGGSIQRTNRQAVLDFSYSPDGKYFCFSEKSGKFNQIYQTSARNGYVCRQITSNNKDYSPVYSADMKNIFFARQENRGISVWSYNIGNNFLSNYTKGQNPYPLKSDNSILCARLNANGRSEIWRVNYETGTEECILSDPNRSFTTPTLSPDGKWILLVGSNVLINGKAKYANTDIFVCHTDGTNLTQITYHAADDLSPTWSRDGKYIYFISQRGSITGTANVWRMTFIY